MEGEWSAGKFVQMIGKAVGESHDREGRGVVPRGWKNGTSSHEKV